MILNLSDYKHQTPQSIVRLGTSFAPSVPTEPNHGCQRVYPLKPKPRDPLASRYSLVTQTSSLPTSRQPTSPPFKICRSIVPEEVNTFSASSLFSNLRCASYKGRKSRHCLLTYTSRFLGSGVDVQQIRGGGEGFGTDGEKGCGEGELELGLHLRNFGD